MKYGKSPLEPLAFFMAISASNHTGELVFRNGQEVEINKENVKQITTCFNYNLEVGTQVILDFVDLLGTRRSIKYHFKDKDVVIKEQLEEGELPSALKEWDIVSFEYSDMSWVVEQIAEGNTEGKFYTASGKGILANKDTVILDKDFPTSKGFTVKNPENNMDVYYRARQDDFYCVHGQLASLNIIDFIKHESDGSN